MLISLFKNFIGCLKTMKPTKVIVYFKEMNFFYIWIAPGWLLWTVNFLSLTTDFEMSETCENC